MPLIVARAEPPLCIRPRCRGGDAWRLSYSAQIAIALVVIAASFGVTTLVALEGHEVVIVRTTDAAGRPHDTRTWIADAAGAVWIEAATPARPFAQHIARSGRGEIVRSGEVRRYDATIVANPQGHIRIRALLAEKYGWADWWVGLLQDTSGSIAIRFMPIRAHD